MKRKQSPRLSSEAMSNYFAPTTPEEKPVAPYDLKYGRSTFRLPTSQHEKIKGIARAEGIGLNDLVRYILHQFITKHEAGEITLPIEHYITTNSRLTID